jgi:hypothetical protein
VNRRGFLAAIVSGLGALGIMRPKPAEPLPIEPEQRAWWRDGEDIIFLGSRGGVYRFSGREITRIADSVTDHGTGTVTSYIDGRWETKPLVWRRTA